MRVQRCRAAASHVRGNGPDPQPNNNVDDEITTIKQGGLDVEVIKSDEPDSVWALDPLTYTIQVNNTGTELAAAVDLVDTLPIPGLDYTSTVAIPSQGVCAPPGQPQIQCTLGDIAAGASATILVSTTHVLVIPPHYGEVVLITNTVDVSIDPVDIAPENNHDIEPTTVVSPCVEVVLVLDKSGSMMFPNSQLWYDLKSAAQTFVQVIEFSVNKVGVVSFNNVGKLVHRLSRNQAALGAAIQSMPDPLQGDSTNMVAGINLATSELTGQRHNPLAKKVMIFMSDGINNDGADPPLQPLTQPGLRESG